MTDRDHPFGWPPLAPTRQQLDALAPEWREKLWADYEAERISFLSSVLLPLLGEVGCALGLDSRPLASPEPKP